MFKRLYTNEQVAQFIEECGPTRQEVDRLTSELDRAKINSSFVDSRCYIARAEESIERAHKEGGYDPRLLKYLEEGLNESIAFLDIIKNCNCPKVADDNYIKVKTRLDGLCFGVPKGD